MVQTLPRSRIAVKRCGTSDAQTTSQDSQKRDFRRGQNSAEVTALRRRRGPFVPKVDVGAAPHEGAATKPKGSVPLPSNRQTRGTLTTMLQHRQLGLKHRLTPLIQEPCSSGAPNSRRIDWSCNDCKTESASSFRTLAAAGNCSTEDLQRLQSRLNFKTQDMDAPGRSCSGMSMNR